MDLVVLFVDVTGKWQFLVRQWHEQHKEAIGVVSDEVRS